MNMEEAWRGLPQASRRIILRCAGWTEDTMTAVVNKYPHGFGFNDDMTYDQWYGVRCALSDWDDAIQPFVRKDADA